MVQGQAVGTVHEGLRYNEPRFRAIGRQLDGAAGLGSEDLAQEARIAYWRSWGKAPEKPDVYHKVSAGNGAKRAVLRNGWLTGMDPSTRGVVDPLRGAGVLSLDAPPPGSDSESMSLAEALDVGGELLDGLEMAYHQGEIAQALGALSPRYREYVVRKFWGGQGNQEIASAMGVNEKTPFRWWKDIKPVLQEKLAHLEGVV